MNKKDLIGQKFGRLTVESFSHRNPHGDGVYSCKCDCGNKKQIIHSNLTSGATKSCGCLKIELTIERLKKHGMRGKNNSKEERKHSKTWNDMKNRCSNKECVMYNRYGGRGITVSNEWFNSYESFFNDTWESYIKHIEEHGIKNTSLDRINNELGYSKENCRWATRKIQNNNRSNSKKYKEYGTKTK